MPKIDLHERLFTSLVNKKYSNEELEQILPVAKAELDGYNVEEKSYRVELNDTNRPDLWSTAGVARLLNSYATHRVKKYDFFSTKEKSKDDGGRTIIVDSSAQTVRPFSVGFAITGVAVDEEILLSLIQSQEKLCHNFGQKRKTVSIGVYRSDLMRYPIHFGAVDPDTTRFVPLHMEEELTLRQICERHPKGQEYCHIVADKPLYPLLYDDNKSVLSFPPVINSAHLGAVEVGDQHLFFDFSGTNLDDLLLSSAIMACDCADLGFTILPVTSCYEYETPYGKEITVPYYFQESASCRLDFLESMLGIEISESEVITSLAKMGITSFIENEEVHVTIPPYRNDFLHPVDIVEDVMIGYGMERFEVEMPNEATVGRVSEAEIFARKVKDIMVGLGFQEMMYNYLGSKKEYIDNMRVDGSSYIQIANPMSENYEFVRPSIIPSLLESESVSAHAMYPHLIFEIGKVAFLDESDNSGTTTRNYLGFLGAASDIGFNQLNSQISTLFYYLRREYTMKELIDPRFIEGRCAQLISDGKCVGILGEVHPGVLENWGIFMPTVACEIDLDLILKG